MSRPRDQRKLTPASATLRLSCRIFLRLSCERLARKASKSGQPGVGSDGTPAAGVGAIFVQWNCTVCLQHEAGPLAGRHVVIGANSTCRDDNLRSRHHASTPSSSASREASSRASSRAPGTGVNGAAINALG